MCGHGFGTTGKNGSNFWSTVFIYFKIGTLVHTVIVFQMLCTFTKGMHLCFSYCIQTSKICSINQSRQTVKTCTLHSNIHNHSLDSSEIFWTPYAQIQRFIMLEKVFNMYHLHFYKYVKTACKGLYGIISGVHNKPSKTFALNASYLCGNCFGAVTRLCQMKKGLVQHPLQRWRQYWPHTHPHALASWKLVFPELPGTSFPQSSLCLLVLNEQQWLHQYIEVFQEKKNDELVLLLKCVFFKGEAEHVSISMLCFLLNAALLVALKVKGEKWSATGWRTVGSGSAVASSSLPKKHFRCFISWGRVHVTFRWGGVWASSTSESVALPWQQAHPALQKNKLQALKESVNITWCRVGAKTRSKPCMNCWIFSILLFYAAIPLAQVSSRTACLCASTSLSTSLYFILSQVNVRICSSRCFVGNTFGRSWHLPLPVARKISFSLTNWSSPVQKKKKKKRLMKTSIVLIEVLCTLKIVYNQSLDNSVFTYSSPYYKNAAKTGPFTRHVLK